MTGPIDSIAEEPIVRPAPHRWFWYALGGRLPRKHRGWVLFDTTTSTWWLRHTTRSMVQLVIPIALIMVFVPGSFGLRVGMCLLGIFLALIYSTAYIAESTETRVKKAGYPVGTALALRDRAGIERQRLESERKRAAATKRAARYQRRADR
ncbi:DUF5313 family protein [Blastococcus sp. TML/M2B]|uniref:DUF5313 family protein n=1 Tax=unclassified Blastococcus TaxID=2619396 RepID=UPI00190CB5E7|nr:MULTISPECIES: DUF5313 family protein [unclassified Blastococcus]MBN1091757.1 DUF5313 family protein [Blastococcus sp. TML/M2B]MBN1094686.1 DUF5313 family protein [Blastococcus sp. TML/C7B]